MDMLTKTLTTAFRAYYSDLDSFSECDNKFDREGFNRDRVLAQRGLNGMKERFTPQVPLIFIRKQEGDKR